MDLEDMEGVMSVGDVHAEDQLDEVAGSTNGHDQPNSSNRTRRRDRQKDTKKNMDSIEKGVAGVTISKTTNDEFGSSFGFKERISVKLADTVFDGKNCLECKLGDNVFGELLKMLPECPVLPPILANQKVDNVLRLAWLCTIATNDEWSLPKKIAACGISRAEIKLSTTGIALSWFLACTACRHAFEEEKTMRLGEAIFSEEGTMIKFADADELLAAFDLIPSMESVFARTKERAKESEKKGNLVLIPREMGSYNSRIRWKNRTMVMNYGEIDFLGDVADRLQNLQVHKIVVVPPLRPPMAAQRVDFQSLVLLAEKIGAAVIEITPPMYTEVGYKAWCDILPELVEEQNRRLKFIKSQVRCHRLEVSDLMPTVDSPFGFAGADPLRGKSTLDDGLLERFLRKLGQKVTSLAYWPDRKRTMNPNVPSEVKRHRETQKEAGEQVKWSGRRPGQLQPTDNDRAGPAIF